MILPGLKDASHVNLLTLGLFKRSILMIPIWFVQFMGVIDLQYPGVREKLGTVGD